MIVIAIAPFAGCASATTVRAATDETVEVTLSVEQKKADVSFGESKFQLTLSQIVDSRCPANAKCIWAGELAARIVVQHAESGQREITLGESTTPSSEVLGVRLELIRIDETTVTFSMRALGTS